MRCFLFLVVHKGVNISAKAMASLLSHLLATAILSMAFLHQSSTGKSIPSNTDERYSVDVELPENPFLDPNSWRFDPDASGEDYFPSRNSAPLTSGDATFILDWPSDPDASYER
ncbi:uncharacterized protein LOC129976292 [Argiope bruennichi]|uniref:uncharacterized protein LOC129976292 n=1 Tax=Argiope bruennichi TaxID=94029 RepID=UPI002495239A|nr:uncharacterized protein LOC129976292 [Argiope bruennichi]